MHRLYEIVTPLGFARYRSVFRKVEFTARMPPLLGQCHQLKHPHTDHHCHCEERSDVAIRPFGVTDVDLQRLNGERIATPVCGLVRNDSLTPAPGKARAVFPVAFFTAG